MEIARAIRELAAQEEDRLVQARRAEVAAIRRELDEITQSFHAVRDGWRSLLRSELRKAGYNPDEPRVPAGNPDGGQWTRGNSG